jgi:hypothetical protein
VEVEIMKKVKKRVILTMDLEFTEDEISELSQRPDFRSLDDYCLDVARDALLDKELLYFDWGIMDIYN